MISKLRKKKNRPGFKQKEEKKGEIKNSWHKVLIIQFLHNTWLSFASLIRLISVMAQSIWCCYCLKKEASGFVISLLQMCLNADKAVGKV